MSIVEIPDTLLLKLIEMGKADDLSQISSSFTVQEQRRFSYIMRLRPELWFSVAESLNKEDMVALIKCLTIAEQVFNDWKAGSVSPVIWLFKRLVNLEPTFSETIADWVLANTENYYLPFGTMNLGAKSLTEYVHLKQSASERAKARREAEVQRQDSARQRKVQEATHALIGAIKRGDVKAVKVLIAKGANASAIDSDDVSVREYAHMKGNEEILELLKPTGSGE